MKSKWTLLKPSWLFVSVGPLVPIYYFVDCIFAVFHFLQSLYPLFGDACHDLSPCVETIRCIITVMLVRIDIVALAGCDACDAS